MKGGEEPSSCNRQRGYGRIPIVQLGGRTIGHERQGGEAKIWRHE